MKEQRVLHLARWYGAVGRQGKTHAVISRRAGSVQALCGLSGIVGGNCGYWHGSRPECWNCRRQLRLTGGRIEERGTL
jgi:hypothetical protein